MNLVDPNELDVSGMDFIEEELSVDDLVQIESDDTIEESMTLDSDEESALEGGEVNDVTGELRIARGPIRRRPPWPPIRFRKRLVSGCYRSPSGNWKLDLRVDIDGRRPMRRISGDYYYVSGRTVSYFGSFIVNSLSIKVSSTQVAITGIVDTTWRTSYNKVNVIIPRRTIFQPPADATLQWMTSANRRGSSYTCVYKSRYFRTVDIEQDYEKGVTPFTLYNTGSLPSGGSARTLTVAGSYAEAGVQMRDTGGTNEVAVAPGGTWSNAELHAAMEKRFSRWKDLPQWKVWLFHAMKHDRGPGLRGIMFDQKGKQRQGCATFYQRISGTTPVNLRDQLYVCVHELGHCFNLFHSFHKRYMTPPVPNRPAANSWMNYPQRFPGGAAAFWAAFSFQFDNQEVVHLRHAFRNNIIMGGNPFGTGASLEGSEYLGDNVSDDSGLRLELETRKSFALGEPVVAEIKLSTTDAYGKQVNKHLHPNDGSVQIAIQQPNGGVIVQHPPIEHCMETEIVTLDKTNPSIYESAYIGYDKDRGLIFNQPGIYKLRGIYYAFDGSIVLSDAITLNVRVPLTTTDCEVADLFLGDDQGMLLYLLGSDSESLRSGTDAFDLVLEKYSDHPLAVYANLINGFNASREFKDISDDYQVAVREPEYGKADKLLSAVIDASEAGRGVDNITLNMTMQCMVRTEILSGKKEKAQATIKRMIGIFEKKSLKPHVMSQIKLQAEEIAKEI